MIKIRADRPERKKEVGYEEIMEFCLGYVQEI